MLIINYVGLADRTAKPMGNSKPKARSKTDWAWRPYRVEGSAHGRIRVYRPDAEGTLRRVRTMAPGRAKLEARG